MKLAEILIVRRAMPDPVLLTSPATKAKSLLVVPDFARESAYSMESLTHQTNNKLTHDLQPRAQHPRSRPPFECIALLLQGGGALGAYQAGVYLALAEARLDPDWVASISIGAINAAVIAGNARGKDREASPILRTRHRGSSLG
jgi:predicted acylesterase/phospholipase RssA